MRYPSLRSIDEYVSKHGATKILLSLSLFFFSLNVFSVRATALAYLSLAILVALNLKRFFSKSFSARQVILFCALNFFVLAISLPHGIYFNSYLKFLFISIYFFFLIHGVKSKALDRSGILFASRIVIIIHATFFLVQLCVFLSNGNFIEFNGYVREVGSDTLYSTKSLSDSFISVRATGLFSEPSFYAMTVLPFSAYLLFEQRAMRLVQALGFFTVILSFSVAGILVAGGIVVAYVLFLNSRILPKIAAAVALCVAVSFSHEFIESRVIDSADYDAIGSRMLIFGEFEARPFVQNLFGSGFFWDETKPIGYTNLEGYNIRDSSFFVYIFFAAGAFGVAALLISLALIGRDNIPSLVSALILLLLKFHILYGLVWIIFVLLYQQNIRIKRS